MWNQASFSGKYTGPDLASFTCVLLFRPMEMRQEKLMGRGLYSLSCIVPMQWLSERPCSYGAGWKSCLPGENCPRLPQIPEDTPISVGHLLLVDLRRWEEFCTADKQGLIWVSGFLRAVGVPGRRMNADVTTACSAVPMGHGWNARSPSLQLPPKYLEKRTRDSVKP